MKVPEQWPLPPGKYDAIATFTRTGQAPASSTGSGSPKLTPGADPDCDPACGDDGVCATNCPVADLDCGDCDANGVCHQECPADPDCSSTSSGSSSGSGAGEPIDADDDDGGDDDEEDDPSRPIRRSS